MASLSTKLKVLYPDVDSTTAWELCDDSDGRGVYISKWNLDKPQPTSDELEAVEGEGNEVEALHKIRKKRLHAYPSVGDQLDQLMRDMRDGTTTHKDACEAVKLKYPKP